MPYPEYREPITCLLEQTRDRGPSPGVAVFCGAAGAISFTRSRSQIELAYGIQLRVVWSHGDFDPWAEGAHKQVRQPALLLSFLCRQVRQPEGTRVVSGYGPGAAGDSEEQ